MSNRTAVVAPDQHSVTAAPRVRAAVLVTSDRLALAQQRDRLTVNVVAGAPGRDATGGGSSAPEIIISNTAPVAPTAAYLRFETDGSGFVQRVFLGKP